MLDKIKLVMPLCDINLNCLFFFPVDDILKDVCTLEDNALGSFVANLLAEPEEGMTLLQAKKHVFLEVHSKVIILLVQVKRSLVTNFSEIISISL